MTSSHQNIRRLLVAACVIFAMGVAGMAVGREASRDEASAATLAVAAPIVDANEAVEAFSAAPAAASIIPVIAVKPAPKIRTIEMEVTAYCACTKCCGPKAQGITASGKHVSHNDGFFVAADKAYSFGTKLIIPGYAGSKSVEVLDRGGAIKGNKLDVHFATHQEARKWGRQKLTVTVVE